MENIREPSATAWQDLVLALRTAESFQRSIRHADTKTAALISAGCGMLAFLTAQAGLTAQGDDLASGVGPNRPLILLRVLFNVIAAAGLVGAAWHLGAAIRPRLSPPGRANRFAFAAAAHVGAPAPVGVRRQADDAWRLSRLLARIALDKHRRVQRGIDWLIVTALGLLGGEMLVVLSTLMLHRQGS
jgi:hypothetical protein